jgi:hypothetical protein
MPRLFCFAILLHLIGTAIAQPAPHLVPVAKGWASNSVNTVVFRKNALVTWRSTQYIAFYDSARYVVLGKRALGTEQWQLVTTPYRGNAADAHNCISIMVDGEGYLHLAWDHHNNPLHYCRSKSPGSLEMGQPMPMTGQLEQRVSYPEFYRLPNGNLLFFYRNGQSGQGNLVINTYNSHTQQWEQLHNNLVDGEAQRSAYWQACIDKQGVIHLSWVWRESADVASNHDLCYARSRDGGRTWEKSTGESYTLPVTAATAEYACRIPQKSELINQTSMVADDAGHPYIATYWRDSGTTVPQYHIVYNNSGPWQVQNTAFRQTAFSLSGMGTKRIPIARPQLVCWQKGRVTAALLVFRDAERGDKVSTAFSSNIQSGKWSLSDYTSFSAGSWEPTYDTELWKDKHLLHLFVQRVEQADSEGKTNTPPQMVQVLEINP